MKKLLALAPLGLLVAACSAMNPSQQASYQTGTTAAVAEKKAYDRMMPDRFRCEDGATVDAKYSMDTDEATVTASLPKAKWNKQTLKMAIAPSGSGSRYVNTTNSDTVNYEWHTKGDMGIMTLNWSNGETYSVNCQRIS